MDDLTLKKESRIKRVDRQLRAMPIWQNAVIASTVWFWGLTVFGDLYTLCISPLYNLSPRVDALPYAQLCLISGFATLMIGMGFIFPICFAGWMIHHIYNYLKFDRKRHSIIDQIVLFIGLLFGLIFVAILPLVFFLLVEWEFTLSLFPFATSVCALLWAVCVAQVAERRSPLKGTFVICGMILLILSLRFIDLNSRKPFLRDLGGITLGMTGQEVKAIMGKYDEQVTHSAPLDYEYLESDFNGEEIYRHTNEGWGNADWGIVKFHNGHVVGVEFSHD